MRLLLNFQFWDADKAQAMALARLLADLEPVKRTDCIFLFSARFDCDHDHETVAYVSEKFETRLFTTKKHPVGWPAGPNNQMAQSYTWAIERHREGSLPIDAVFFMEADCVPLKVGWLDDIIAEYTACGKQILGPWLTRGDGRCNEHVNGNCIIGINFWRTHRSFLRPPGHSGWDAYFAFTMLPEAHPSRLIFSDYRLGTSDNEWKGCDYLWQPKRYPGKQNRLYGQDLFPVWYHGIKTMDGIECVRNRLTPVAK